LNRIEIISRQTVTRRWEQTLVDELRSAGYVVAVTLVPARAARNERALDVGLRLTRRAAGASLADPVDLLTPCTNGEPQLIIDLVGDLAGGVAPVLKLEFLRRQNAADGLAAMLASGELPSVVARVDGLAVGRAAPMLDNRVLLGRVANSMLSAAISLTRKTVGEFFAGKLGRIVAPALIRTRPPSLLGVYLPVFGRGLVERAGRKLSGRRLDHWQVAYRLIDGPGVADTGRLEGAPFAVLPDDGTRFYADPFVFERNGRYFVFVEDYPFATRKGVISAAEMGPDGRFGVPRPVIEEPHHLSYPQILTEGGQIYMLPESSGGRELVLYRATEFPYRWVRDTVLLQNTRIADATLLVRDGRHWLIGTARPELGSSSDTMVIYSAPALRGPWTPHKFNPIVIDRAAARPGGALVDRGGRLTLPVQNGERSYGGGLGLMDLVRLDDDEVAWGPVRPIEPGSAWKRQGLHTLNRAGRLEVVDSTG
jgi:hypothetical protein